MSMSILDYTRLPKLDKIVDAPVCGWNRLYELFIDMSELCIQNDGIGLSAVQVGVPWKAFVIRYSNGFRYFLNCEYAGVANKRDSVEGCLSISSGKKLFKVERFQEVRICGKELSTNIFLHVRDVNEIVDDAYATVFQHEIDHHNGILINEIGEELLC